MPTLPMLAIAPGATASFDDPLANLNTGGRTYLSGNYRTGAPGQVAAPTVVPPASAQPVKANAKPAAPAKRRTYTPMASDNGSFIRADGTRFLSAKDIRYDKPGSVAAFYEWTGDKARKELGKLYANRTDKSGGNAYIFGAVSKYAGNTGKGMANWDTLRGALSSGDFSKVSDAVALQALDFGFREQGRQQQNKSSFLDSVLGKVITIGAEVAAAFAGGPIAAAAVGAGVGGVRDGWKGAAFGALEGYGVGKGTEWLTGGGPQNLFNDARNFLTGTVTDVNALMPADIAARAGTSAAGTAGATGAASLFDTAARGANITIAGLQLRDALVGGAAVAGAVGAATSSAPAAPAATPPAPGPGMTPEEEAINRLRNRRRATRTVFTWNKPLMGTVTSPTLGGGLLEAAA